MRFKIRSALSRVFAGRRLSLPAFVLAAVALLGSAAPVLEAQGFSNASKSMDIFPWAGYLGNYTAIAGPDGKQQFDGGYAFGVDITKYFNPIPVAPSFEARVNQAFGPYDNEKSYVFGLKLEAVPVFFRARPYVTFEVGPGTVHYVQHGPTGLYGDNSTVYAYGGGIDFNLVGPFRLKVDGQYQKWKLGTGENITPATVIVGVVYKVPFKPHFRHDDPSGK